MKLLPKILPFLFKKCPQGNWHWRWEQVCWCGWGKYNELKHWHGGLYVFPDQEGTINEFHICKDCVSFWKSMTNMTKDSAPKK